MIWAGQFGRLVRNTDLMIDFDNNVENDSLRITEIMISILLIFILSFTRKCGYPHFLNQKKYEYKKTSNTLVMSTLVKLRIQKVNV